MFESHERLYLSLFTLISIQYDILNIIYHLKKFAYIFEVSIFVHKTIQNNGKQNDNIIMQNKIEGSMHSSLVRLLSVL
jgi:Na+/H+ antiporter NhaC